MCSMLGSLLNFIHIPRTGGSSFKYAIRKGYYGDGYMNDCYYGDKYQITLNGHGAKVVPSMQLLFIVRDPVERFVSSFCSRFNSGGELYKGPHTEEERISFGMFETPNLLGEALDGKDRGLAEYAITNIQHVFTSYWDWFRNESTLEECLPRIFWVGRTKHLNEDFERLKKKMGLSDEYKLPSDPIKQSHITTPDRDLSEGAIANLRKWYELDYYFIDILKSKEII